MAVLVVWKDDVSSHSPDHSAHPGEADHPVHLDTGLSGQGHTGLHLQHDLKCVTWNLIFGIILPILSTIMDVLGVGELPVLWLHWVCTGDPPLHYYVRSGRVVHVKAEAVRLAVGAMFAVFT